MNAKDQPAMPVLHRSKFKAWIVCAAAFLSFAAGSLATAYIAHAKQVGADSDRVFELVIYHTVPSKAHELEELFRGDSKLMTQHGIDVLGFWVPNEDPEWKDAFVYVADFPSRDEAKKRWAELHADPATRPYVEPAKLIIEKVNEKYHVDEIYMRPSDFSALK